MPIDSVRKLHIEVNTPSPPLRPVASSRSVSPVANSALFTPPKHTDSNDGWVDARNVIWQRSDKLNSTCQTALTDCYSVMKLLKAQQPVQPTKHFEDTAFYFQHIKTNPNKLRLSLSELPKVELHGHTTGHLYAEQIIKFAAENNLYVDLKDSTFHKATGDNRILVSTLVSDPKLSKSLEELKQSMNIHKCSHGEGLTRFFKACIPSDSVTDTDYMPLSAQVIPVLKDAASDNIAYMELMGGFRSFQPAPKAYKNFYSKSRIIIDLSNSPYLSRQDKENLGKSGAIEQLWHKAVRILKVSGWIQHNYVYHSNRIAKCEQEVKELSGNKVEFSFIKEVARDSLSEEDFFLECVAGFTLATKHYRVKGVTLVGDETSAFSTLHFNKQMSILNFLHEELRFNNITLHAGEFLSGSIPSADANARVYDSILRGRAKRIGHGCFMSNNALLVAKQLRTCFEICLGMNKKMLGIKPEDHIFRDLLTLGIDFSFNRDNGGINGSSLTDELVMAVNAGNLDYAQLKNIMRVSSERSFLKGEGIYQKHVRPCKLDPKYASLELADASILNSDEELFDKSPKATLQRELERRFVKYEQSISDRPEVKKLVAEAAAKSSNARFVMTSDHR